MADVNGISGHNLLITQEWGFGQDERLIDGERFRASRDPPALHDIYLATDLRGTIFQNKYQTTPLIRTTATTTSGVLAFGGKADSMKTPGKRSKTPRSIGAMFM